MNHKKIHLDGRILTCRETDIFDRFFQPARKVVCKKLSNAKYRILVNIANYTNCDKCGCISLRHLFAGNRSDDCQGCLLPKEN